MSAKYSFQYHNVRDPSPVLYELCLKPVKTEALLRELLQPQKLLESEYHLSGTELTRLISVGVTRTI